MRCHYDLNWLGLQNGTWPNKKTARLTVKQSGILFGFSIVNAIIGIAGCAVFVSPKYLPSQWTFLCALALSFIGYMFCHLKPVFLSAVLFAVTLSFSTTWLNDSKNTKMPQLWAQTWPAIDAKIVDVLEREQGCCGFNGIYGSSCSQLTPAQRNDIPTCTAELASQSSKVLQTVGIFGIVIALLCLVTLILASWIVHDRSKEIQKGGRRGGGAYNHLRFFI